MSNVEYYGCLDINHTKMTGMKTSLIAFEIGE